MKAKVFFVCLVTVIGATIAETLQCPSSSRGKYPTCKCLNGATYDVNYNWCASDLKDLEGKCPSDGPGVYPNCDCGAEKSFDKVQSTCTTLNRNVCPNRATGNPPNCNCGETYVFDEVHWYCRPWYLSTTRAPTTHATYKPIPFVPRCGASQYGTYPDCHWRHCPKHAINPQDFEPHCRYDVRYVEYKPCPAGLVGAPPNCYKPCPAYHRGKYPNCERIRCQTGPGWSGDFAPDCKYTPSCPPEFPGVWPYCDIYKAKPTVESITYLPPITSTARTLPSTYLPPTTTTTTTTTTRKPTVRTIPSTYLPPVTTTTRKPTTTARIVNTYLPPSTTTQKPTTRILPNTYLPPKTTAKPTFFKTLPPFNFTFFRRN